MSTFEATLHQLPKPILNKLRAMINRVRRLLLIRGFFATLAVGLTCVLLIMAIDASVTLFSNTARWALSLTGLGITTVAAWWFLVRPLSRRFSLTQIARILEIRHPELQERISTAVELMQSDDPDSIRGSEELIEAVVDSAVVDVQAVDPKTEFKAARASKFVMASGVVALLIALLFVIWPQQSWTLMARAIAPFMNIGNAYADTLVVDPGNVRIAVGETVTVKLAVQHKNLRKAQIRRTLTENSETVERMTLVKTEEDGTRHFEITFPSVEESFDYRVRAGAAVSEYFRVEAVPKPTVENLNLRYDFPAYTQRSPEEFSSDTGEIKALAHTQVTVSADLNKPVTEAKLLINEAFEPVAAEIVGNRASWRFELRPGTQGVWKIALRDADDFSNTPPSYSILALPDEKPRLAITSPEAKELRLKPSELLPIKYQVAEDYGFSQVDLLVTPNGEQEAIELIQPTPESDGQAGVWRGTAPLNLTSLDLEGHHNRLTVQLRARDNMPEEYEGPNVGLSEKIIIILDKGAKSLAEQTMEAQKKEIQEAIDEAQKELNEAKNEAKEAERQLAKEDTVSQDTMEDLEDFRENTNTAQETLREVAERLDDTVFNQQAEQLEKVADEEVADAREAADMIPVTDKKEERVAEAREAREQVEQALADLQEIENSLRESNEDMEMIAELNDLANEQRELAQQAQENAEQQEQQTAQNEQQAQQQEQQQQQQMQQFQQQQEQVQNELGEMLRENPEALRDILEQQQQQAQELSEQAQEMAQQQEQVREMTQNAAREDQQQALEDQLVSQLQQMQEQVARETQELQNQLNEQQQNAGEPLETASEQTQQAAENLQQENLENAAEAAQEAAEALTQAQEQSEAMAEQQAQNAEQMQAEAQGQQPEGQEPQSGEPQAGEPQMAEAQSGEPQSGEPQSGEPQAGEPQSGEPQSGEPQMAEAQSGEPQSGEPRAGEPQSGEPQSGEPQVAEAQSGEPQSGEPQSGEPQSGEPQSGEPQAGEPQSGEPQMAEAQSGEPQSGQPQAGEPQSGQPQSNPLATEETQAQLAELAETQEMIAQQLEAIEAGQLEDALAMMEQQLAEQSESLQAQAEALEQATQAAQQQNAAAQANRAENQLQAAATQTAQAQQQLAQAQQAQDAAEAQGQPAGQTSPQAQQALQQSGGPQNQAQQSMSQAAQSLQQTAEALGQAMEAIDSGQQEEQMLDGQELADSFEDVSESAQSQNAQEAAQQSQQAAQSLQQLAQSAMEQMGQMGQGQPQDQPGQEGQPQPQQGQFVDGSQELNESGMKNADINGDGVPPELKALGISIEDWSRLKGTLQSGSASQGGDGLPAEYRDLVSRYFQVIAKEAGKNK